jgi:RHS repeat-associated protein
LNNVAAVCDRRTKRLRLPSFFWRGITVVTLIVLIVDDPSWDYAFAQCSPPATSNIADNTTLTRVTSYTYDFDGRLTQMNSPEGYIDYGYDAATGRLLSTCTTNSYITNSYDILGRLKTVTALKRNGSSITPETATYSYDNVGNRSEVDLPSGVVTTYLYDGLNRLTNMMHKVGSTTNTVYRYGLDATGRRTNAVEVVRQEDSTYLTNTLTWQFDGMYRLTNEMSLCSSNVFSYTNQYAYTLSGNRFTKTSIAGNTVSTTNLYDANDELLREVIKTGTAYTETSNYAYDANGSMIGLTNSAASGSSTNVYAYNLMNKLAGVTSGTSATGFQYNDQGIRVRTTGASTRYYLIDANNHTGFQQVLEEFATLGSAPAMSYVIGDDVLAQASGSTASYLLYDGHGSTRQVTSNTGGVTSRYNYDGYGITQTGTSTGSAETSMLYCGEQYDSGLGMYNLRARYYNPCNGRFNQKDTFMGNNEDPQSLHKYAYASCDPCNRLDPSGLMSMGEILVVSLIIGIMAGIALPTIAYQYQKNHYPPGLLGTFVHSVISAWYNLRYPGVITNQAIAAGINNDRPDIRFPPGFSDPLLVGEVYEIKPEGRQAEAESDLTYYIGQLTLNQSFVQWRTGTLAPPPRTL